MGNKGIGIIIVVFAGIAAAFYFLKGKMSKSSQTGMEGRTPTGVIGEKRHTPVYKEKPAKSQQEIKKEEDAKKLEKGMACYRAYKIEYAKAANMQEGLKARKKYIACTTAARK